jgi:PAS domain S-box-containing protein
VRTSPDSIPELAHAPLPGTGGGHANGGLDPHDLLSMLPAAIYTTDAAGRITYYNPAAARLWGCRPEIGTSTFCGSWRLYWPDGKPMPHDQCPMAETLRTGRPVRGVEALAERPDGTRVAFIPCPTPLFDSAGRLVGAINMLVDISERKAAERAVGSQARLFQTLNSVATVVATEPGLDRIVQTVMDIAVEVSGARLGGFLMNAPGPGGEARLHGALPTREDFERLGLSEGLLDATLRDAAVVRTGAAQAASYLAIPVCSLGRTHGALVLAHPEPGAFTAETEEIIAGIAAHAAVAIDNARLLESDRRLAAIVEASGDAIVSKDLNGIVRSWNHGAERLFGYTAEEMIGNPIVLVIPAERRAEEEAILERIRRGEPVDPYETVRVRKDGTLVDVSLSVSPVKDAEGRIIGASKIARDITERKQAQARQELLTREIHHRTRNLFAVVDAVVARSFAGKRTVEEAEAAVRDRLRSLAQTHALLIDKEWQGADLSEVVRSELTPYDGRVTVEGPPILLNAQATQNFALALHELATNAAKYGALSNQSGHVHIAWSTWELNGLVKFRFRWEERGGPPVSRPVRKGFGSTVLEQVMAEYFDEPPRIEFAPSGVRYELSGSLAALAAKS